MDELENKMASILQNPEMMQKIMAFASTLSQPQTQEPPKKQENKPAMPEFDLSMLQKLSGLAGQTGIDKNQKTLLSALAPYLSGYRINKLERAMRAAKMARLATGLLGNGGLDSIIGR